MLNDWPRLRIQQNLTIEFEEKYYICTYFDGTDGIGDCILVCGEYGGGDVIVCKTKTNISLKYKSVYHFFPHIHLSLLSICPGRIIIIVVHKFLFLGFFCINFLSYLKEKGLPFSLLKNWISG